jgi:hypothetical protein
MTGLARHFDAPFDAAQDILYVFARVTGVSDCIVSNWLNKFQICLASVRSKEIDDGEVGENGIFIGGKPRDSIND